MEQSERTWRPIDLDAKSRHWILGLYDDCELEIRWADNRQCMLSTVAPGAGQLGPGWEDRENHLPVDPPISWRPL